MATVEKGRWALWAGAMMGGGAKHWANKRRDAVEYNYRDGSGGDVAPKKPGEHRSDSGMLKGTATATAVISQPNLC